MSAETETPPKESPFKKAFVSSMTLMNTDFDTSSEWLVDQLLISGGTSLLAGPPKAGKSTLARKLALAVASGGSFLDRSTTRGAVLFGTFEEKESQVKQHLCQLGAQEEIQNLDLHFCFDSSKITNLETLKLCIEESGAKLLIVDTIAHYFRIADYSAYGEVSVKLQPLLRIARDTGVHICFIHHSRKSSSQLSDKFENVLGSQAFIAAVDTIAVLNIDKGKRTISTRQRYGEAIEESVLHESNSSEASLGGSLSEHEENLAEMRIMNFLRDKTLAITSKDIQSAVGGSTVHHQNALRRLLEKRLVTMEGTGVRGDPYLYSANSILQTVPKEEF